MTALINQVLTLGVIIIVGVILAKLNILTLEVRQKLSKMLITVVAPMYIIKSFQVDYSSDIVSGLILSAIVGFVTIGAGVLLGVLLWRRKPVARKKVLIYATGLMNCAFLGYPLIESIFGVHALVYAAIYVMIFNIYLYSVGIWIFSGKPGKWYEPFRQPGLVGVTFGLILFLLKIRLPYFLSHAFGMIGSMTAPMAMLIIGAFLSEVDIKSALTCASTYVVCFLRLVLAPALVLLVLTLLGVPRSIPMACVVLISGMPSATNTVLFATNFDGDAKYAASVVSISTILGLITIPIWVLILNIS